MQLFILYTLLLAILGFESTMSTLSDSHLVLLGAVMMLVVRSAALWPTEAHHQVSSKADSDSTPIAISLPTLYSGLFAGLVIMLATSSTYYGGLDFVGAAMQLYTIYTFLSANLASLSATFSLSNLRPLLVAFGAVTMLFVCPAALGAGEAHGDVYGDSGRDFQQNKASKKRNPKEAQKLFARKTSKAQKHKTVQKSFMLKKVQKGQKQKRAKNVLTAKKNLQRRKYKIQESSEVIRKKSNSTALGPFVLMPRPGVASTTSFAKFMMAHITASFSRLPRPRKVPPLLVR
jgi:hypothetical protein